MLLIVIVIMTDQTTKNQDYMNIQIIMNILFQPLPTKCQVVGTKIFHLSFKICDPW